MKTKLILLILTAATLCGCDPGADRLAYYTYINGTDKVITVTLYNQDYYRDVGLFPEINPDAKPLLHFMLAPKEECTHIVPPEYAKGIGSHYAAPFADIPSRCLTLSNGESLVVEYYDYHLFAYSSMKLFQIPTKVHICNMYLPTRTLSQAHLYSLNKSLHIIIV